MTEATAIEWCDSTFNPWAGCTKISPACDHCYAEGWAKRSGQVLWGNQPRKRTSVHNWNEPRRWQRRAPEFFRQYGRRRRVFCASLADVFDNQVPVDWRDDLWSLIRDTPDLDWLLLTKRPQNIGKMLPAFWSEVKSNIWLGTTVEDQQRADQNIPHLLQHDAAVRFLSCEPLLGAVDLRRFGFDVHHHPANQDSPSLRALVRAARVQMQDGLAVDWVIVGGESGPGARPMQPTWVRSLREQCTAAGVPFLFKQWGEWAPPEVMTEDHDEIIRVAARIARGDARLMQILPDGTNVGRLGKKLAGRLLDGVEHNGFPVQT